MEREEIESRIEEIEAMIDGLPSDWLKLNFKENHKLECLRCGETDPVRVGISVTYFVNLVRAFRLTHALCEERSSEQPG